MSEEKKIHAVGFFEGLPIDDPNSFIDTLEEMPKAVGRDLLIKVQAVSVNPVDTKLRQTARKSNALRVLGFDAVGEVAAVGNEVENFKVGDQVFYAGTTSRRGSNQEYQIVDERIVALAPEKLSTEEAAALPLTSLTAYELLFDKFNIVPEKDSAKGKSILVINGAGGVGSVLNQLAKWTGLEVFATSNPKNFDWLAKVGVDHPLDYHQDLKAQLREIGTETFDYIAVLFDITKYLDTIKTMINPFGHVGTIVGINEPLELAEWKNKSVSFDWEYMFAKTDYGYDLESQGQALKTIAKLADDGILIPTVSKIYDTGINADNLKRATKDVESGHMLGKVVISGGF